MSCADDRFTDEQLALYLDDPPPDDDVDLLGPHLWYRRRWWPVDDVADIGTYQPAT